MAKRGRVQQYPWDLWFSQPRTVLERGRDYRCSQSTMTQNVRNQAWRRGVSVKLTDCGNSIVMEVNENGARPRRELPVGGR